MGARRGGARQPHPAGRADAARRRELPHRRGVTAALVGLSGGEQKRLVLESLLRGNDGVLLLDEPDNYLDVPGKRWLQQQLASTPKTPRQVSHDREMLPPVARRVVTLQERPVC